tara:strand:+ start:23 stop:205 length:183 start_codon:yes stop_codon:yes gene_type:complete
MLVAFVGKVVFVHGLKFQKTNHISQISFNVIFLVGSWCAVRSQQYVVTPVFGFWNLELDA